MSEHSNDISLKMIQNSLKDLMETGLIFPPQMVPMSSAEYAPSEATNDSYSKRNSNNNNKPRNQKLNKNYATSTNQAQSKNNNLQPDLKPKQSNNKRNSENNKNRKSETSEDAASGVKIDNNNSKGGKSTMKVIS